MNARSRSIEVRGWVAVGFAFAAVLLPMLLNALGFANYESERDGSDPSRPADQGLGERICLVSDWMGFACLLVWAATQLRVRNALIFESERQSGRLVPLTMGVAGLFRLVTGWLHSGPYTGEHYSLLEGWRFGLGWFLIWWCLVFVRTRDGDSDTSFPRYQSSLRQR